MNEPARRGIKEGVAFGISAGLVFAAGMMVVAVFTGSKPLTPLRFAASILQGEPALYSFATSTLVLGLVVHVLMSGLFGLFYGLVNAGFTSRTQTTWSRQLALGIVFGAALWILDFQIIARGLYPWFLDLPQAAYLLLHALLYGLPLSVLYAGAERRLQHVTVGHA